eukprot:g13600.t1
MVTDCTKREWVAEKLSTAFGKMGSFRVVVEKASEKTRTEFKVSSVILSSWSEVFEKMMLHEFEEQTQGQVVIKDFSSHAMEVFLRFLYSGTLNVDVQTLVEVMVIADKYQVPELSRHCNDLLHIQLSSNAWDIFIAADSFRLDALREAAFNAVLMCPKRVLQERPAVSDELVHEVLGSDFLCLSDEELLDLLMEWKEADEGHISKRDLIEKYVCLENVSGEKIKTMLLTPELQFLKSACRSYCRVTRSDSGESSLSINRILKADYYADQLGDTFTSATIDLSRLEV